MEPPDERPGRRAGLSDDVGFAAESDAQRFGRSCFGILKTELDVGGATSKGPILPKSDLWKHPNRLHGFIEGSGSNDELRGRAIGDLILVGENDVAGGVQKTDAGVLGPVVIGPSSEVLPTRNHHSPRPGEVPGEGTGRTSEPSRAHHASRRRDRHRDEDRNHGDHDGELDKAEAGLAVGDWSFWCASIHGSLHRRQTVSSVSSEAAGRTICAAAAHKWKPILHCYFVQASYQRGKLTLCRDRRKHRAVVDEARLDRALLQALVAEWHGLNRELFAQVLTCPVFSLSEDEKRLGLWRRQTREILIQRQLAYGESWGVVIEVLKHEMAHQYVDEVLHATEESPHGPAFRRVCEDRGIDGRAQGLPKAGDDSRILGKVSKLLALAGSSNQHEAEAAMAKAQAMMLRHNLQATERPAYEFRQIGTPRQRIYEHARWLAAILSEHFFIEAIWVPAYDAGTAQRGTVLEICGTPENLAIAEYVHGFLQETGERLWRDHRKAQALKGHGGRRRFLTGVMRGFLDRLEKAKTSHAAQGLVWVGDGDLDRYLRTRHPRTTRRRRRGGRRDEHFQAGRAAGEQIVLHKPVSRREEDRGRLLPPPVKG